MLIVVLIAIGLTCYMVQHFSRALAADGWRCLDSSVKAVASGISLAFIYVQF